MRILFLCHRIPYPPDKGEKIRAFHQLRALAARHEVDVFTLADDPRDLRHREGLAAYCRTLTVARIFSTLARLRSLPFLLSRTPLTIPYFHSAWLRRQVDRAVEQRQYDRIFVYSSAMFQYVPTHIAPARVILDLVDVDSDKWAQYATATSFPFSAVYRRESRSLRAYERFACERAGCVVVTTEREAQLARAVAPTAGLEVVTNGVDTDYFSPQPGEQQSAATIIFTGDMGYFPNRKGVIFFAREVLPLIRASLPDVRFIIVGRNPGKEVETLGSIAGVEVTGFVEDVRPWLAKASMAVAPLLIAAGVQNKILEALSSGLPVVATSRAIQGLTANVAALVDTAETAEELAAKTLRILTNPGLARARGDEGRRRVTADYNWDRSMSRLLQLVENGSSIRLQVTDEPQEWIASA